MDIRYTADHEWVAIDADAATVGITDHAQSALGELVFVQLPEVGTSMSKGAVVAVVESVKAASDIFAPLSGTIVASNAATVADPSLINKDPMGAGWLFKMRFTDETELTQLLDQAAYQKIAS